MLVEDVASVLWTQNIFDQKELQIKKSALPYFTKYLLKLLKRFSMRKINPFPKSWSGRYLGILDIRNNFKELYWYFAANADIRMGISRTPTLGRAENAHDIFINLDGAIQVAVQSKKPTAVALVKWLTKKGAEKVEKERQQAIEEHDQEIALLHDDLKECDNQIQATRYENIGLQEEIRTKD